MDSLLDNNTWASRPYPAEHLTLLTLPQWLKCGGQGGSAHCSGLSTLLDLATLTTALPYLKNIVISATTSVVTMILLLAYVTLNSYSFNSVIIPHVVSYLLVSATFIQPLLYQCCRKTRILLVSVSEPSDVKRHCFMTFNNNIVLYFIYILYVSSWLILDVSRLVSIWYDMIWT